MLGIDPAARSARPADGSSAGRGYASYRIFGSLSFTLTAICAVLIPQLSAKRNTELLFIGGSMILLLAAIPLAFYRLRGPRPTRSAGILSVLGNRQLQGLYLAAFFFAMASPAIYTFTPAYARQFGAGNRFLFMFSLTMGGVALVALPTCGRLVDRFGPRTLLLLAFLAQPLRALGYSFAPWLGMEWLLAPQVLHFFSWAGFELGDIIFVTRLAGPGRAATALALLAAVLTLGFMAAALPAGYIAEHYGYPAMYWASAGAASVGLMVFATISARGSRAAPAGSVRS